MCRGFRFGRRRSFSKKQASEGSSAKVDFPAPLGPAIKWQTGMRDVGFIVRVRKISNYSYRRVKAEPRRMPNGLRRSYFCRRLGHVALRNVPCSSRNQTWCSLPSSEGGRLRLPRAKNNFSETKNCFSKGKKNLFEGKNNFSKSKKFFSKRK